MLKTKNTIKYWKSRAWEQVSLYVRTLGAWEQNGELVNKCYTCDTILPIKKLQAGHLIDGRNNSILTDTRGIRPQCMPCNVWKHGNKIIYYQRFEKECGRELIDDLQFLSGQNKVLKWFDYQEIYEKYHELISSL